jgi:hypothetical protein
MRAGCAMLRAASWLQLQALQGGAMLLTMG